MEGRQGLLQLADHVVEARGLLWPLLTLVPESKQLELVKVEKGGKKGRKEGKAHLSRGLDRRRHLV